MSFYKTHEIGFESSDVTIELWQFLSSDPGSVALLPLENERTSKSLRFEFGNGHGEGLLVYSMSLQVIPNSDMIDLVTSESSSYIRVLNGSDILAVMQNITDISEFPLRSVDLKTITLSFSSRGMMGVSMQDIIDTVDSDATFYPDGAAKAPVIKVIARTIFQSLLSIGDGTAFIANYWRWADPNQVYSPNTDIDQEPYLFQWLHRLAIDLSHYDTNEKVWTVGMFLADFCKAHAFKVGWSHNRQKVSVIDLEALRGGFDPFGDDGEQKVYNLRPYVTDAGSGTLFPSSTNQSIPLIIYNEEDFIWADAYNNVSPTQSRSTPYHVMAMFTEGVDPWDWENRFVFDPSVLPQARSRSITTNWKNFHEQTNSGSVILDVDNNESNYITDIGGLAFSHESGYYYQRQSAGVGPIPSRPQVASRTYANTLFYQQSIMSNIVINDIVDPMIPFRVTGFAGRDLFDYIRGRMFQPVKGRIDLVTGRTQMDAMAYGRATPDWFWDWRGRI